MPPSPANRGGGAGTAVPGARVGQVRKGGRRVGVLAREGQGRDHAARCPRRQTPQSGQSRFHPDPGAIQRRFTRQDSFIQAPCRLPDREGTSAGRFVGAAGTGKYMEGAGPCPSLRARNCPWVGALAARPRCRARGGTPNKGVRPGAAPSLSQIAERGGRPVGTFFEWSLKRRMSATPGRPGQP